MSKETQTMLPESAEPVYQLWSDEGFGGWTDTDKATYCWWLDSKNPPRMRKLYTAPVAAQPDVTQQTLDDVMAGIPARDAEIEALRKEIEALQAAPVKPYSLDLDPAGIRALTADAISGALALGFQGVSPPPNNEHWLAPFWEIGRESAVQAQQPVSGADRLPVKGDPWSGWACQHPGKLPRLYGDKAIAELNHHPEEGDRLFQIAECTQQDADKVDAALAEMVHAMFRSGNSVPVTRITIDRKQYEATIDAARKEQTR